MDCPHELSVVLHHLSYHADELDEFNYWSIHRGYSFFLTVSCRWCGENTPFPKTWFYTSAFSIPDNGGVVIGSPLPTDGFSLSA